MTDKPNGSANVATLYAVIGQLTVENQALKGQIAHILKMQEVEAAPAPKPKKSVEKAQEAN